MPSRSKIAFDILTSCSMGDWFKIPQVQNPCHSQIEDDVMVSPSSGKSSKLFNLLSTPIAKGVKNASLQPSDFVSPSKEGEISMEFSPYCTKRSSETPIVTRDCTNLCPTQQSPTVSPIRPSPPLDSPKRAGRHSSSKKRKLARTGLSFGDKLFGLSGSSPELGNSNSLQKKSARNKLFGDADNSSELQPADIFAGTGSPCSPDTPVLSLFSNSNKEGAARRRSPQNESAGKQTELGFRRCHSLEMRKNLFDLSNTPPNAFSRSNSRRSLFKRPLDFKRTLSKRLRDGSLVSSEEDVENQPQFGGFPTLASPGSDLPPRLVRTASQDSMTAQDHDRIKSAVDSLASGELVADGSRNYCLPMTAGKHQDLKNINHQTMADILNKKYEGSFDQLTVIDCRYPYEYQGGHIKGALNIYTETEISLWLDQQIAEAKKGSHILVFHCEFSSQRGPHMLRHLRSCDRQINMVDYPKLAFPEVYCLAGGYKEFYAHHPDLCEPHDYVTMNDENFVGAYLHFKARAKSWTADSRK